MAGAIDYNKYPHFDMSEITSELEFGFKKYEVLNPMKKGDEAPDFTFEKDFFRWKQFVDGVEAHRSVHLLQLLNKPLVIAFYSGQWQAHGLELLKQVSDLQNRVRDNQANVLVVTTERDRNMDRLIWDHNLSLRLYLDTEKTIAEKFGVYSVSDPVWNRFSGIDNNVPLLATYVISPGGKILFDHIDWDFSGNFPVDELFSAIESERTS